MGYLTFYTLRFFVPQNYDVFTEKVRLIIGLVSSFDKKM